MWGFVNFIINSFPMFNYVLNISIQKLRNRSYKQLRSFLILVYLILQSLFL